MITTILTIILLICLASFFSACETALTGVNRIRLKHKAENGSVAAKKALKLIEKYESTLTTLLIGNNIVNLVATSVATVFAIQMATAENEGLIVAITTTVMALILIIFGDIFPKTLAREHADSLILATAGILNVLLVILTPFSVIILFLQRWLAGLFRRNKKREVSVTEEELMQIIDEIEDEGVLEEHESLLVRSALEFDETAIEEILTPRVDMAAVDLSDSVEKVRDIFVEEGYSRLPVYDKTPDKIVGLISNKEFMKRLLIKQENGQDFQIIEIMQDIVRLPALMRLSDALKLMQKEKSHLAVVLDQYGGTEGLVTMEDILEELVGEIWDEDDEETQPIKFVNRDVFEVGGELSINDFNRFFEDSRFSDKNQDIEINSESNTVAGWVIELFEKIPDVGESINSDLFKITVLGMERKRIGQLRFELHTTSRKEVSN